eukprot:6189534-Pleurochrysis_carterae.AAC.7
MVLGQSKESSGLCTDRSCGWGSLVAAVETPDAESDAASRSISYDDSTIKLQVAYIVIQFR